MVDSQLLYYAYMFFHLSLLVTYSTARLDQARKSKTELSLHISL